LSYLLSTCFIGSQTAITTTPATTTTTTTTTTTNTLPHILFTNDTTTTTTTTTTIATTLDVSNSKCALNTGKVDMIIEIILKN